MANRSPNAESRPRARNQQRQQNAPNTAPRGIAAPQMGAATARQTNGSINRPTNQPTNRRINRPADRPLGRSAKRPVSKVHKQRLRRRRIVLALLTGISMALLGTAGMAVGRGIGYLADVARQYLPEDPPPLTSKKVAPPTPVDISGPATACPASSLAVVVSADNIEVLREKPIIFNITVTHTGRYPCLVNGGDENLRLRILGADDSLLWSTDDCPESGHRDLLLGVGHSFSWEKRWNGRLSASGRCTDGQRWAPAGQIRAIASLAEVAASDSEPAPITINEPAPKPEPIPLLTYDSLTQFDPNLPFNNGVPRENGITDLAQPLTSLGDGIQNPLETPQTFPIENPAIQNPAIEIPVIENPAIENPVSENPVIENQPIQGQTPQTPLETQPMPAPFEPANGENQQQQIPAPEETIVPPPE